jgi:hypothetical protein
VIAGLLVIGAFVAVLVLTSRLYEARAQHDRAARERDAAIAAFLELQLITAQLVALSREEETK